MSHSRISLNPSASVICPDDESEEVLLSRICAAYQRTVEKAKEEGAEFEPTPWWQDVKAKHLQPVQKALLSSNIPALRSMYRNFFYDPCGLGLVRRPPKRTTSGMLLDLDEQDRRAIHEDMVQRIGYWRAMTGGLYALTVLEGSRVGNPFGATIDGVFIPVASEYQHACADRIQSLTRVDAAIVEIGGGYGHMAYYLLRDAIAIRYLGFDMPESLALAAYYLGRSFPARRMLLYGEGRLCGNAIGDWEIVLMPPWEMRELASRGVQLTFSSHAISDLTPQARDSYLRQMARFTDGFVVDIAAGARCREEECEPLEASFASRFKLVEKRRLEWNVYRAPEAIEWERVYRTVY
jgi:hypothetical protein